MTTTEQPTQADYIYDVIKEVGGGELHAAEIVERVNSNGHEFKKSSLTATLSNMPNDRLRPGVVRTGLGTYAYRPDEAPEPPPTQPTKGNAPRVLDALRKLGTATTDEIASGFDDLTKKQVTQCLVSMSKNRPDVERVGLGKYRYASPNGHAPSATVPEEFRPLIESIPDGAFNSVGMRVVARTKDGDRICVDEQGAAWTVAIGVEARLI
jgi:hypothetical protein